MDYTRYVLKEAYSRIGINFSIKLTKRGYYPKGGGEIKLEVYPSKIKSINFSQRKTNDLKLTCTFSKISRELIIEKLKIIKEKFSKTNFNVEV